MSEAQRLQYLRAMGVDVWVRRQRDAGRVTRDAPAELKLVETRDSRLDTRQDVGKIERAEPRVAVAPTVQASGSSSSLPADRIPGPESRVSTLDWSSLESAVKACVACGLHGTRTQTVFGVGDRRAQWMVIGEAPGADEDAQGEPFVGRAGQLLNAMLKACGMRREEVFIANILKCRPPQNRDPSPQEAGCCTPFLYRQIELVNPRLILCVGRIAAQNLLNTDTPIGKLRGQVHRLGEARRPVVVTYHPAYLLRSPGEKRRAWQDLVLAMNTARQGAAEISQH